jgi:hypothetical protein
MGTWSHEPFGNDTAADWAYGLENSTDLALVESALDKILAQGEDYIDASDSEEAIASIEILAKLIGQGTQSDSYTKAVDAWVKSINLKPGPALLEKAQKVIARILAEDSELLELWQESEEFQAWRTSIEQLHTAVLA